MRVKGKISSWNDERGFGFITPLSGGKRVFVHIKAFNNRNVKPVINQRLIYTLSTDRQGRPCAAQVKLPGDKIQQNNIGKNSSWSVVGAIAFLAIVGLAVPLAQMEPLVIALYLVASTLTFIIYAVDKSAAQRGAWRTSESTLHLLALAGGWPGALVAQQKLRHKSQKQSFRAVFWVTVLLNCGAFIWLFTPTGKAALHSLLGSVV